MSLTHQRLSRHVVAEPDDRINDAFAATIRRLSRLLLLASIASFVFRVGYGFSNELETIAVTGCLILAGYAFYLSQAGRYAHAGNVLLLLGLFGISLMALAHEGVSSPFYTSLVLVIYGVGIHLSTPQGGWVLATYSALFGLGLMLFTGQGDIGAWTFNVLLFYMAAYMQRGIRRAQTDISQTAHQRQADLVEAAQALYHAEAVVSHLYQHSQDIILVLDAQGVCRQVNPAIFRALGYLPDAVVGTRFSDLLHPEDIAEWLGATREVVQRGTTQHPHEHRYRHADGGYRVLSWRAFYHQGDIYAIARDMTEVRALAERQTALRIEAETLAQRQNFLSVVSHEFRTPLAVVRSSRDMLARYGERMTPTQRSSHLDRIAAQTDVMTHMIDEILLFNRLGAAAIAFEPQPTDLGEMLRELLAEVALADHAEHEFLLDRDACIPVGVFDRGLLRHIFQNLLSNAVKFSPAGGRISVRLWRQGDAVQVAVQDEGLGISEADQKTLFQPFFRAANSRDIQGTGLGLAIVQESVARHGGSVRVTSQLGQGTIFTVRLPFVSAASGQRRSSAEKPPSKGRRDQIAHFGAR